MKEQVLDLNNLRADIIFAEESHDEETFHQEDLVQLFPYGLSVTGDVSRPFLLLKDASHAYTLPVAVSPIEAGVALSQSNKSIAESTPHKFTQLLMESLGIEVRQAVFVEIKGANQYVRLYLTGHPKSNSIKVRADEAMSLCLHLNTPIFATKNYIGRSKVMSATVESNSHVLQNMSGEKPRYLN
ncbi:bifunctional nuclease family protein [Bdellovibrio sp. HCB185ZH]|uniref:bifunctional nuclease family protein n=1 Tax=Bdellovibrio sp. HCB185ZH TaxID=3394235 RepID=UPI0039A7019C